MIAGNLYDLQDDSTEKVNAIIKEAIEKGGEKGSKEQKIADFYNNILDTESRNKIGIAPIKPYLADIDAAKNVKELADVQIKLIKNLYMVPFTVFSITTDFKDNTKYIMYFGTAEPYLTKDFYINGNETQKASYLKYLKTVLEIAGETVSDKQLEDFYNYEKKRASI